MLLSIQREYHETAQGYFKNSTQMPGPVANFCWQILPPPHIVPTMMVKCLAPSQSDQYRMYNIWVERDQSYVLMVNRITKWEIPTRKRQNKRFYSFCKPFTIDKCFTCFKMTVFKLLTSERRRKWRQDVTRQVLVVCKCLERRDTINLQMPGPPGFVKYQIPEVCPVGMLVAGIDSYIKSESNLVISKSPKNYQTFWFTNTSTEIVVFILVPTPAFPRPSSFAMPCPCHCFYNFKITQNYF